ncbi:hypothetical protein [Halomonas sp. PA5]|uniref:hypothetical protein n=1 Tax=Halomonadaceae TaxID=28256 RepID=UPI00349F6B33
MSSTTCSVVERQLVGKALTRRHLSTPALISGILGEGCQKTGIRREDSAACKQVELSMGGRVINLFMWGYQEHYRISLQILARDVLKALGAPTEAEVLLVGARSPNSECKAPAFSCTAD